MILDNWLWSYFRSCALLLDWFRNVIHVIMRWRRFLALYVQSVSLWYTWYMQVVTMTPSLHVVQAHKYATNLIVISACDWFWNYLGAFRSLLKAWSHCWSRLHIYLQSRCLQIWVIFIVVSCRILSMKCILNTVTWVHVKWVICLVNLDDFIQMKMVCIWIL